jgi:hypothetical protein
MDLMRLLRSLEEFLYELVGWLVFYPRTFWRILRHPGAIARYTRIELTQEQDRQFGETISPVLMLVLSVALVHALELALKLPFPSNRTAIGQLLFGSEQALLLTRSAVFSVFALGAALGTLRQSRQAITRDTLREPFSIQAFLVCPFVVLFSTGELLSRVAGTRFWGFILMAGATVWYVVARAVAYRALNQATWLRSVMLVLGSFLSTAVVLLLVCSLMLL